MPWVPPFFSLPPSYGVGKIPGKIFAKLESVVIETAHGPAKRGVRKVKIDETSVDGKCSRSVFRRRTNSRNEQCTMAAATA
jgi:hypothetical protein